MTTTILYHDSCADGFCAAYVAWLSIGDEGHYVPVQYGNPIPDITDSQSVYILDFSYDAETLKALAARSASVVVLDHHRTAQKDLDGLESPGLVVTFDMDRSGAGLAWDFFFRGDKPPLVQYVQDRDLWRWELPFSREISAAIAAEPKTFVRWQDIWISMGDDDGFNELVSRGDAILTAQKTHVASLAGKAFKAVVGGHAVPAVNSSLFQSEIGEELCRLHPDSPFAAIWFGLGLETEVWSLRSRNGFDVSLVAKQYGGGGHAAAAGFRATRGLIQETSK